MLPGSSFRAITGDKDALVLLDYRQLTFLLQVTFFPFSSALMPETAPGVRAEDLALPNFFYFEDTIHGHLPVIPQESASLTEDGLPWLRGAETHTFTAKRNTAISAAPVYLCGRAAQHTIGNIRGYCSREIRLEVGGVGRHVPDFVIVCFIRMWIDHPSRYLARAVV